MGKEEGKVQRKVFKALRLLPSSYWFKLDQRNRRGDPDIIGSYKGWFIGIECKKQDGDVARLQTLRREQLIKTGAEVVTIQNDAELELFIQRMRARGEATKRRGRLQVVKDKP